MFEFIVGFAAGFALDYFCRDAVVKWYKGAEDYAGMLQDKAKAILDKVQK